MMNLDREQLGELLSAYLDDQVSAEERSAIEALLEADDDARRMLETLRLAAESVALLPKHGAPQSIAADIQFHVERAELLNSDGATPTAQRGRRMIIPAMVSMAAVLGLSVGGIWIMMGEDVPFWGYKTEPAAPTRTSFEFADVDEALSANTPEKLASADSIETEERFASSASMDQKMRAGMLIASARRHAFENEPVRLKVTARNAREGDALQREVVAFLRTQEAMDISDADETDHPIPNRSFYLTGRRGVNFEGTDKRQVLVRVPRRVLAQMVDRLTASVRGKRRISLAAGPVSVRGATQIRSTLSGLNEIESDRMQVASESEGGWLENLIRLASAEAGAEGDDKDNAQGTAKINVAKPIETIVSGAAAPAAVAETKLFADARSKNDDADAELFFKEENEQPSDMRQDGAFQGKASGSKSTVKDEASPALHAERNVKRSVRGDRAHKSRSSLRAGLNKKIKPSTETESVFRSEPITGIDATEKAQSAQDGYVTLIVEITFDPPRPARPAGGKPASKVKSKTPNAK